MSYILYIYSFFFIAYFFLSFYYLHIIFSYYVSIFLLLCFCWSHPNIFTSKSSTIPIYVILHFFLLYPWYLSCPSPLCSLEPLSSTFTSSSLSLLDIFHSCFFFTSSSLLNMCDMNPCYLLLLLLVSLLQFSPSVHINLSVLFHTLIILSCIIYPIYFPDVTISFVLLSTIIASSIIVIFILASQLWDNHLFSCQVMVFPKD